MEATTSSISSSSINGWPKTRYSALFAVMFLRYFQLIEDCAS